MNKISSPKSNYPKYVLDVGGQHFNDLLGRADAFIFAAGFEGRATRVPFVCPAIRNVVVIVFEGGPQENDVTLEKVYERFNKAGDLHVCVLNFAQLERFEKSFEASLKLIKAPEAGELVMDISAMPNFSICVAIAKIRQLYPTFKLTLLYTEAQSYFPPKEYYTHIKRKSVNRPTDLEPEYLSTKAVAMFIPSMFSGVTLGQNDTCLIVFVGYEPHRTNCAIEALNPNKLVLVYGVPGRADLGWRLELSKIMHRGFDEQVKHAEEQTSTSNVDDNLSLIVNYYEHLYDDHTLAVSPINSKIQAVAAVIAWETYPDIQLNFPIPAEYLPHQFSTSWGKTYAISLGTSVSARRFAPKFLEPNSQNRGVAR
ncbi:MAG: hypothetical protein QM790_19290 [Nibricoccus sp.]